MAALQGRAGGRRGSARLILCTGTLGRVPFQQKIEAAAAAGYDGISIYSQEHAPRLDLGGLRVAEVDGAMAWLPGQPGPWPSAVVEIANDLDARSITVIEVTGEAPDVSQAAEAFAEVCAMAAPRVVHIEPFPWSGIPTLRAAAAIVRRAGMANAGVLLDTWHLARSGGAMTDLDLVVALQVSDVAAEPWPSVRDESMHGRLVPGAYAQSIIAEFPEFEVEIEVFNDELFALPPAEAAMRAYGALS